MKLHASGEDYLETILVLQKKLSIVRSVDVARHMEVTKPSVCHAVATLRDGGFLMMDEDHIDKVCNKKMKNLVLRVEKRGGIRHNSW